MILPGPKDFRQKVSCIKPTMEGRYQISLRCYTMSLWTLVVILFMLLHYSESACSVQHCNTSLPCNGYICYGCNDGYYLQSGWCHQCPDRCSTCTSSTQCTTCKVTYWNPLGGCPFTCSTNCTNNVCDDTTGYCYVCKPGTYGQTCGQDCNSCKDEQCDLRKCTNGCKDGYFQENSASGYSYCYKCVDDNCLTCSNGTYCTLCEQGYYRNYYRQNNGRGTIFCLQCFDSCMDCSSTEHCHEDCINHCSEPVTPGTTNSINKTTTLSSTTTKLPSTSNNQQTSTKSTPHSFSTQQEPNPPNTMNHTTGISTKHPDKPQTDSTATTHTSIDCHYVNGELYKELNSCQQRIKTYSESEDQNQITFGHGFATGFGVAIVLFASGVGIALFIRRQTKQHKNTDENSEGHHEYVNTNMTDILSVLSSENNEVNNDIHTVSSDLTNTGVTNIESTRDYVMLGDRPTHESDYTDLQTT